jgi:hypothetical protein
MRILAHYIAAIQVEMANQAEVGLTTLLAEGSRSWMRAPL